MAASRRKRLFLVWKLGLKFSFQIIFTLCGLTAFVNSEINLSNVNHCASHMGYKLYETAKIVTYMDQIKKSFESSGVRVQNKNGTHMVMEMSEDIQKMMAWKIQAIQRITDTAEEAMMGYQNEPNLKYVYNNAKTLNTKEGVELELVTDPHFYDIPVNIKNSSIHVPTNVYDEGSDVVNAIKWSENLNPIFQSNFHLDPSLSWQYFGSSTGFLRQYPAMEWTSETIDTYDCRMRPWYIEAATHPKDMIILLDTSGSMTGKRKEIAKHVVLNILDTLNDDDYFTIYKFNDTIEYVVPCFNDSLVPANMENIREFKKSLQKIETSNIANFSQVLIAAFELLRTYNESKAGSSCNQAIMLITDGAPHMFEEIFKTYNWPHRYVRVFTYLIGQEKSDVKEVMWMACSNRGFYTHVSTIAEARDQVQNYVTVMARPLVLHNSHEIIWTSVYADIADPKLSDYLWEKNKRKNRKELQIQRHREAEDFNYRRGDDDPEGAGCEELMMVRDSEQSVSKPDDCSSSDSNMDSDDIMMDDKPIYRLMTTVAYPVFDRSNKSDRMAHILGVAGTDVPIDEITKLAPAYKLGVNGYAFAITNNGYILFHPDLRPFHSGILKPDYNSVDLTEVELRHNDLPPRVFDDDLLELRRKMIDGEVSHTKMLVKIHLDDMKRIVIRRQNYFFSSLDKTPFSFAIAMPDNYGMHEILGKISLSNYRNNNVPLDYKRRVLSLFENNWTIHPNWVYCRNLYSNPERPERTLEETLVYFLNQIPFKNFSWGIHPRVKPVPSPDAYCDQELIESLIFDANATKNFDKVGIIENRTSAAQSLGVTISFVATRTGLTRWDEFDPDAKDFVRVNNKAIDELWYKRAVDYHLVDNKSFVFSVPFDACSKNDSLVTATYAIFVGSPASGIHRKAPVAVVGLQFKHAYLSSFLNGFSNMNCSNAEVHCYLLDNNGFVIYDENAGKIGKFYGEVTGNIMNVLVKAGIYKSIHMVDYQAVCLDEFLVGDSASFLLTPFRHLKIVFTWAWYKVVSFFLHYSIISWWNGDCVLGDCNSEDESIIEKLKKFPKERPSPCDKDFYLYELNPKRFAETTPQHDRMHECSNGACNKLYAVQQVPHTNLVLLVVEDEGKNETAGATLSLKQKQIDYNETQMCHFLKFNIYRKRPRQCVNYHPKELDIKECSRGALSHLPSLTIVLMIAASSLTNSLYTTTTAV